ncbi:MAG TPA: hypothetical protein VGC12_03040 [Methyloradius sp.]
MNEIVIDRRVADNARYAEFDVEARQADMTREELVKVWINVVKHNPGLIQQLNQHVYRHGQTLEEWLTALLSNYADMISQ